MSRATVGRAVVVLAGLVVAGSLWGCVVRPTPQVATAQPQPYQAYVVQQTAPMVVSRPVYVTQPQVVVQPRPVYVSQPPVIQPYRYTGLVSPARHCMPGTQRSCGEQTYCGGYDGGGMQYCNPDGMSWSPCYETRY